LEEDPPSDSFEIRNSQIPIIISLRKISSLHPHEETVPKELEGLAGSLREDPFLRHPIIVDRKTGLVLDGTHRLAALALLECKLAPCALVDYQNPRIRVERWFRTVSGSSLDEFETNLGVRTFLRERPGEAEKCLAERRCYASLEDGKSSLVFPFSSDKPIEYSRHAFQIEVLARDSGLIVAYKDGKLLPTPDEGFILSTIRLEKTEIVRFSLDRTLFPPKTTRHIIPSRPLGILVPLEWLKTWRIEEAQHRFRDHLQSKKVKYLPGGSTVGSRRYEEEVFIFE
jgi:hypothetical protein